jgi:hypothetical protein
MLTTSNEMQTSPLQGKPTMKLFSKAGLTAALMSVVLLVMMTFSAPARADGFLGHIVNQVAPGAGTQLDKWHDQMGKPLDAPGIFVPGVPVTKAFVTLTTQPFIHNMQKALDSVVDHTVGRTGDTMSQVVIEAGVVLFVVIAALMVLWAVLRIFVTMLLFPFRKRQA